MRTSVSLMLALLLGTCAWAQRGGMRGGFGGGVRMGGGGVRVGVGGVRSGFVGGPFHGRGFGAFHGFRGGFIGSGFHNRFGRGFRNRFDIGVGFGSPFGGFGDFGGFGLPFGGFGGYWGGGFYPYYGTFDPMYSSYFNPCPSYVWNNDCGNPGYTTIGAYDPQPAQPAVVISQQFETPPAHPVITEYPDNGSYGGGTSTTRQQYGSTTQQQYGPAVSSSRTRGGESPIYLIAFHDQVIRPALAYWVKGGTLYYLGVDHREKQAPLSSVDRAFSQQLNDERNVPFRLPG